MKRFFALLLAILMLAGTLVGCTQPETPPSGDGPDTPPGGEQPPAGDGPDTPQEATFYMDFKVSGSEAAALTAALQKAGIALGGEDATKTIYAGESDTPLAVSAKEKATAREACYNDFAILCNGTDLAVYGATAYATEQAISYLIKTYKIEEGAKLAMPKDLSYVAQPTLTNVTIGGYALHEMTVVVTNASCLGIAQDMAKRLSILTGYEVKASTEPSRRAINLSASNTKNEDDFSTAYTVGVSTNPSVKISELNIQAATRASLSYAVQSFVASLTNETVLEDGYAESKEFALVHTNATNTDLFKYCGTWQATDEENPNTMVSYWNASYVEINFTGNAITPVFSKSTTFKVKIDNAEEYSKTYTVNGPITFFVEGDGEHTIKIFYNDKTKHMYFAGVSVCEATTLSRTPNRAHYIQFVGDSISDGQTPFTQQLGDVLGWDFSVSALSGIALETNYGYWKNNNGFQNGSLAPGSLADLIKKNFDIDNIGMEDAFFKLGIPNTAGMPKDELAYYAENYYTEKMDYNFGAGYTPDAVFIFLGTNDQLTGSAKDMERFAMAYLNFVDNIKRVYGEDTDIWVLQSLCTPTEPRFECIRYAVEVLQSVHGDSIHFIDWDQIQNWNLTFSDHVHPTVEGHKIVTEELAKILNEFYGEE